MAENIDLKYTVPWTVNLYTLWRPIFNTYKKDTDEYFNQLKNIEVFVFIHSVFDSNGNDVSKYVDYLELLSESNTKISLPKVDLNVGSDYRNESYMDGFKLNSYGGNISVDNLNEYLKPKKTDPKFNYYSYANFQNYILGANTATIKDDIDYKSETQNIKDYKTKGLIFKIRLKDVYGNGDHYYYEVNTNQYKKQKKWYDKNNTPFVLGIASNPFFFPSKIFEKTENNEIKFNNRVFSFSSNGEKNFAKCFICYRDTQYYISDDESINRNDGNTFFKKWYYKKSDGGDQNNIYLQNYNYTFAIDNLSFEVDSSDVPSDSERCDNIVLKLTVPQGFDPHIVAEESAVKDVINYGVFQKYDGYDSTDRHYEEDEDDMVSIDYIRGYDKDKSKMKFSIMNDDAKQIICYGNEIKGGINGEDVSSNFYNSPKKEDEISYKLSELKTTQIYTTNGFCHCFCEGTSTFTGTRYVTAYSALTGNYDNKYVKINLGTSKWGAHKYNTLCRVDENCNIKRSSIESYANENCWFFGAVSDIEKPCILFYGMYKIEIN